MNLIIKKDSEFVFKESLTTKKDQGPIWNEQIKYIQNKQINLLQLNDINNVDVSF